MLYGAANRGFLATKERVVLALLAKGYRKAWATLLPKLLDFLLSGTDMGVVRLDGRSEAKIGLGVFMCAAEQGVVW